MALAALFRLSLYVHVLTIRNVISQSITTTNKPLDTPSFSTGSVYLMIFIGVIGMILIAAFAGNIFYNFRKGELNRGLSLVLYAMYYCVCWILCFAYTFLKVDVILPMGKSINCKVGQYFIAYFQLFSLILLIAIFVRRIDAAFYESALAYHRGFLLFIVISYMILRIIANIFYVAVTYNTITLIELPSGIGLCSLGPNTNTKVLGFGLAIATFVEVIYLIIICIMFVYKLNKVVKMTTGVSKADSSDNRLKKIMKKQTILVCLSCVSTILIWGVGGVIPSIGILLHIDTILNAFCVWLMFKFSDVIWNKVVKICCCCCCCCNQKDLLQTLHPFSKSKVSLSSVAESSNPIPPNKTTMETTESQTNTITGTEKTKQRDNNISTPPTPVETNDAIEIKYNDKVVKPQEMLSLSDHEGGNDDNNTSKMEHPTQNKSVELVEVHDESQSQ